MSEKLSKRRSEVLAGHVCRRCGMRVTRPTGDARCPLCLKRLRHTRPLKHAG